MLSIEEEDGGWNQCDVKVLDIHRNSLCVYYVHICHLRNSMLGFGKLEESLETGVI